MPKNEGQTIVMQYYDALTIPTGTLIEGVVPTGSTPTLTEVTISTSAYGDFVYVTDAVGMFDKRGAILKNDKSTQNVELLGEQAMRKLNTVTRDAIAAGSNVYYAGTPTVTARDEVAAGNKPSAVDYRNIVRALLLNGAEPITGILAAGVGQATKPIGRAFVAIIGPRTLADVSQLDGWVNVYNYANPEIALTDEIGAINDLAGYAIRFIVTNNDKVFSGEGKDGIDVYGDVIFGKEFFAETDLVDAANKNSFEFIAKAPGSAGTADPLNQRSTMGWKCPAFGVDIIKEVNGYRYEHAVTE
jgi:N4-gp56 family major capsid protein